jgi:hypothetical protein
LNKGDPHRLNGEGDIRVGDKAEGGDKDEGRWFAQSIGGGSREWWRGFTSRAEPAEDEEGKTNKCHETDEAVAAG